MNQNEYLLLHRMEREKAEKERQFKAARVSRPVTTGKSLKQRFGRQLVAWGRYLSAEA